MNESMFDNEKELMCTTMNCEEEKKQLDKDLEQFLIKWEENMIEANREEIEVQAIENYEPMRDESRD